MPVRKLGTNHLEERKKSLILRDFMQTEPILVNARASLDEAEALMEEYGVRHLPVEDEHHLVGVVSDRDLANGRARGIRGEADVTEVMTAQPFYVDPNMDFSKALEIMASNRLGCILVKDSGDTLVGIFTTTDAVKLLASLVSSHGP